MSESMKLARPFRGAAAFAMLWGLTGSAGASYCGGPCYRSAPAPVMATSCNVVALRPRFRRNCGPSTKRCTRTNPSP